MCVLHKFGLYLISNGWQLQSFRPGRGAIIYKAIVKQDEELNKGIIATPRGRLDRRE